MFKVLLSTFSQQTAKKCFRLASGTAGLARGRGKPELGPSAQAELTTGEIEGERAEATQFATSTYIFMS